MKKKKLMNLEEFEKAIRDWKNTDKRYTTLNKVYASDRKDLRAVLKALKEGNMKKAKDLTWHLDTIVRDVIPNDIYEAIF